jgi:hypothetical protein
MNEPPLKAAASPVTRLHQNCTLPWPGPVLPWITQIIVLAEQRA